MTTQQNFKGQNGGFRPNSGRPALTDEQRAEQLAKKVTLVTQELIFPALCAAFKSEPGRFKDRYLTVELSKTEIQFAYGKTALSIWLRYFKQEKIGGIDRNGKGYKTRWCLHLGSYDIAKLLVESLGHSLKDLPSPGFPPEAMRVRLDARNSKLAAKKAAIMSKLDDELQELLAK